MERFRFELPVLSCPETVRGLELRNQLRPFDVFQGDFYEVDACLSGLAVLLCCREVERDRLFVGCCETPLPVAVLVNWCGGHHFDQESL